MKFRNLTVFKNLNFNGFEKFEILTVFKNLNFSGFQKYLNNPLFFQKKNNHSKHG